MTYVGSAALDELPYSQPRRSAFEWLMLALFVVLLAFAIVAVVGLIMAI
jgi:hypothetical protein